MSVPLRYRRQPAKSKGPLRMNAAAGESPASHKVLPSAQATEPPQYQQQVPRHTQLRTTNQVQTYQLHAHPAPNQKSQANSQDLAYHHLYSSPNGRCPYTAPYIQQGMISPESDGEASSQQAQPRRVRGLRPYNRADRVLGRIVDPQEPTANLGAIDKLISSTKPAGAEPGSRSQSPGRRYRQYADDTMCSVTIRLPSRRVTKQVLVSMTCAELGVLLVKEHRLEFDFELNREGEDDIILWECLDGTRRPLRATERIGLVVQTWGSHKGFLRTTSTTLRNDVDSLASLVPRRDMLKTLPTILAADVHFSRPSIMYNPHLNQSVQGKYGSQFSQFEPQSPPSSPLTSPLTSPLLGRQKSGSGLHRVPSKLNPNDRSLRTTKLEADNDDVSLKTQLVWGFGALNLENGRLVLKQKPGDELVCSLEAASSDIYEWPHQAPKPYVLVLREQRRNSRAVFVSTDSAKVFSVLRNAVFTARSKALLDSSRN